LSVLFEIDKSGFALRAAQATDAKACRMLLPMMPSGSQFIVAVDNRHRLVVGAAGITPSPRTQPLPGPGVMVHVIPPCRRSGIGRRLVDAAASAAGKRGALALYAAQRCACGSPAMEDWRRLGFETCEIVEEHELPLTEFVPRLAPLVTRLRQQGRIPSDARIVPLHAADRAQVLQLHLDHMGGDRQSLHQRLRGEGAGAFHPRYSRVLLVGDRTAGCILAHRKSRYVASVDANIVTPELRRGWANIWLKLEATQGALSLGITHFHFTSFDQYDDTRSFTRKLGGVTTNRYALMWRQVWPGGQP
jgi:GNAT superfamily N-acetyltransferase